MEKEMTIGVLGGMGTYATIHLFWQYAEVFSAAKEWERPRIIIDNRCTMPSRVRAFLYHENVEKLVEEMSDSMRRLVDAGCSHIILACNTSHLFLPAIYEKIPLIKDKVVNIIDNCVDEIKKERVEEVYLLASEGTIEAQVYQSKLNAGGIRCIVPKPEEYGILRECIEAVKQNRYSSETRTRFAELMNRYDSCILGCTELPILYEKYIDVVGCKKVYDPLFMTLLKLKKEYDND